MMFPKYLIILNRNNMESHPYISSILSKYESILENYTGIPVCEKPENWIKWRTNLLKGTLKAPKDNKEHLALQYAKRHIRACNLIDATAKAYRSGNLSDKKEAKKREILIAWHAPLVVKITGKYSNQLELDELLTTALLAVGKALDSYDANKYQWGWGSRGYISTTIERQIWSTVRKQQSKRHLTDSLDSEDIKYEPYQNAYRPESVNDLISLLDKVLEGPEKLLICKLYGINCKPLNGPQIASVLGISRQRVQQIASGLIERLKASCWKDLGKIDSLKWNKTILQESMYDLHKKLTAVTQIEFDFGLNS